MFRSPTITVGSVPPARCLSSRRSWTGLLYRWVRWVLTTHSGFPPGTATVTTCAARWCGSPGARPSPTTWYPVTGRTVSTARPQVPGSVPGPTPRLTRAVQPAVHVKTRDGYLVVVVHPRPGCRVDPFLTAWHDARGHRHHPLTWAAAMASPPDVTAFTAPGPPLTSCWRPGRNRSGTGRVLSDRAPGETRSTGQQS